MDAELTKLANPSDVRTAEGALPPESQSSTLWDDVRFAGRLIGKYFRVDPVLGPLLLALKLGLGAVVSYILVTQQLTSSSIVTALSERRGDVLGGLFWTLLGLTFLNTFLQLAAEWFRYIFRIRARSRLTERLLGRWISKDRYYHLERQARVDHPEQRIQEDISIFVDQALAIVPGTILSLFPVFLYSRKLWSLSPELSLNAIGLPYVVHGYLLILTVVIAVMWTFIVHLVGRRLTVTEITRQSLEAQFRQEMAALRENGEAIAFQHGSRFEAERLDETFGLIKTNWRRYTWANIRLQFTTGIPNTLFLLGPVMLCAPFVIAGRMHVGDIQFVSAAMSSVYYAVGTFIVSYAAIAILRSAVSRIRYFETLLSALPVESGIDVAPSSIDAFATAGLVLHYPDGRTMVDIGDLAINPGDRILVKGPSGIGKSTLLRALAGLWPHGAGRVQVPETAGVYFLPQRSYMADGTLATLMAYPRDPSEVSDGTYRSLLKELGLEGFSSKLHQFASWKRTLSPGEQQRIAAARAIINAPDFLFLDEATSALDLQSEERLYSLLCERLPHTAFISVAHRRTIEKFHDRILDLAPARSDGATDQRPPEQKG